MSERRLQRFGLALLAGAGLFCLNLAQAQFTPEEPLIITAVTAGNELGFFTDEFVDINTPVGSNKVFSDLGSFWGANTVPEEFEGCQYIRTKFSDRSSTSSGVLSFTLSREAQVTVWISDALVGTFPTWVATDGYVDQGHDVFHVEFQGAASGYSAIKGPGTITLDAPTTDGDDTTPMYVVSICSSAYQAFPVVAPDPTDNGQYRFTTTTGVTIPESSTAVRGAVERIIGSDGAVSVDISDKGTGSCVSGTDYTAFSDKTANWADTVTGIVQGVSIPALDITGDCTIELELKTAVGGITAAATNQLFTVSIIDSVSTANIFVDVVNGNDSTGDGSSGNPYKNAEKGVEVATPGDVICLRNGTYTDHDDDNRIIEMASGESGTAGNPITLQACAGHSPLIEDSTAKLGIASVGADYWIIENLEFGVVKDTCIFLGSATSSGGGSNDWIIRDNNIHNCGATPIAACSEQNGRSGIFTNAFVENVTIDSNVIHTVGRLRDTSCDSLPAAQNDLYRHDHGVYAEGKNIVVQNNVIYNMYAGYGIKVDGYKAELGTVPSDEYSHVVSNNIFGPKTNPNPQDNITGAPILPWRNSGLVFPRWLVQNNIFLDTKAAYSPVLINFLFGSSNFAGNHTCRNNIAETASGFLSMCTTHKTEVDPNINQSNNTSGQSLAQLDLDDAAAFDYHIGVTSTAIETGNCAAIEGFTAPTVDKDDNARSATTCDAGPYEFTP